MFLGKVSHVENVVDIEDIAVAPADTHADSVAEAVQTVSTTV